MKQYCFLLLFIPCMIHAQNVVIHKDLIETQAKNTAYKTAWLNMYADRLEAIRKDREKTTSYLSITNEIQAKILKSLSNVDDAIKNGKAIIYISKKIPGIFTNLEKAAKLATGKPFALALVSKEAPVFTGRLTNLINYLRDQVLGANETILIDQAVRDRLVRKVYDEINVMYQLSASMVRMIETANLQDAINSIVPYQTYINVDRQIVNDLLIKFKF